MNYLKAKKAHMDTFGRIVVGVKPFDRGPLFRLVTGRSWCGPWRGIGCHAEKSAIEGEKISERWEKNKRTCALVRTRERRGHYRTIYYK